MTTEHPAPTPPTGPLSRLLALLGDTRPLKPIPQVQPIAARPVEIDSLAAAVARETKPHEYAQDAAAEWSDVYSADELSAAVDLHAARLARMTGWESIATELAVASQCISDQAAKLDEAQEIVARLVEEIRDLRGELEERSR